MKIKVVYKPLKKTPQQQEAERRVEDRLYEIALKILKENPPKRKPLTYAKNS